MIFAAIALSGAAVLTVNTDVRAAFFGWVKSAYHSTFIYSFRGTATGEKKDYYMSYMPEGYTEYFAGEVGETKTFVYVNDSGKFLKFSYADVPDETKWFINIEYSEIKNIKVNGCYAQLLLATDPSHSSAILWTNEDNAAFYVSGYFGEDELAKIAENVKIKE